MQDLPILNKASERKKSIIDNTPAIFKISNNPDAIDAAPFYEIDSKSEVTRWCGTIVQIAQKHKVESTLAMAIMYMETTHGWYEKLYPDQLERIFSIRKSVLPMNIHYHYWRKLGITKENLNCPYYNIEFGIILLSRIKNRLKNPTIKKIASIYNFLGAEKVTRYGARVARLYNIQPWRKKGCHR